MRPDLLESAAGALRETSERAAGEDAATFARVLRDVRHRRHRRRTLGTVALSLGLVVMGVGAWAATTGRLAALARRRGPAAASTRAPSPSARAAAAPEIVPLAPPAPAPAPTMSPAPAARPTTVAYRRPEPAPPPESARAPDDLYKDAHEAHFARRDFAAALGLWDRYLALTPLPRFALEARYNRAIALYRLGRRDEAAAALRPFADGDYGSYRTREARALISPRD